MNPLLLAPLLDVGAKVIDRIFPDPAEQEKAKLELLRMAQAGELAQIEVNKAEASSQSVFVAGWRPGAGWTCVAGLAYTFIAQPLLAWVGAVYGLPTPPQIDTDTLMVLLTGMLGLGGLRSFEKAKGVAAK